MKRWLFIGCSLLLGASCLWSQEDTNPPPQADDVLRNAYTRLAKASEFSLTAEVWQECVLNSGQKAQFTRTVTMYVKRPDRFHLQIKGPNSDRCFWYDGKALSVLDRKRNLYSSTAVTGNIDDAVDVAHDRYGIDLPLIDFALSDPYSNAVARVEQETYYAVVPMMGEPCHHLGFTQDNIDWQVWIGTGPKALVSKFVIDHKNEERAPEFTALITNWSFDPVPDSKCTFTPPDGSSKIEMQRYDVTNEQVKPKEVKRLRSPKDQE